MNENDLPELISAKEAIDGFQTAMARVYRQLLDRYDTSICSRLDAEPIFAIGFLLGRCERDNKPIELTVLLELVNDVTRDLYLACERKRMEELQ
jgi:hypothetical protein